MPNGHPIHFPDYPELDTKEYKAKLKAYLVRLFQNDELVEIGRVSGFQVRNEDDLKKITEYLQGQVELQGVNPRLPFYHEIMAETMTPQWATTRRQEYLAGARKWRAGIREGKEAEEEEAREADLAERIFKWQQETQRWQMKQAGQERMWRKWEKQQDVRQAQFGESAQRWAAMSRGMGQQGMGQEEKAKIWRSAQAEIVGGLTGERDWIKKFQAQSIRNPYEQGSNVDQAWEDVKLQEEEVRRWKSAANIIRSRQKDPNDPLYMGATGDWQGASPDQWRSQQILQAEKVSIDKLLEMEGTLAEEATYSWGAPMSEGYETAEGRAYGVEGGVTRPTTPKTPGWLGRMYPSLGERLPERGEVSPIAAPSGQAFGKLTPSQQAGWAGYAQYTGAKPEDLLAQMQKMLPRQPRIAQKWAASRQWA